MNHLVYTPCYVYSDEKGMESTVGNRTRYEVTNWNEIGRSVHEFARYTKIHIPYNTV